MDKILKMVNEVPETRICIKMKQVIMETPVEYDGKLTTRIPNTEKARFYRKAKKEGIKPAELQRRILIKEMDTWEEETEEENTGGPRKANK